MAQPTHPPTTSQLPDYDCPPVVETVVGVQFKPLAGFANAHLGAFWQSMGMAEWPYVTDAPPLPPQHEVFGPETPWGRSLRFELVENPASRLQVTSRDKTRMLQLQNGRLHLNWLGQGGQAYPRYSRVRADFEEQLTRLKQLLADQELGEWIPDQWEVTYVNHIPRGVIWQSPANWSFFRPLNAVPTIEGVIEAESFSGEWHFIIPDRRGRLHVNWQHAKLNDAEEAEVIRLSLTARGPVVGTDEAAVLTGMDVGHETIVRAFRGLMSDPANSEWRLKNADNG